uniref:Enoyl reductase (ER) domain-containing protein n=1 Tax=Chromera velia CCMP2878 TaxID=1169474 RepID=A0A0G4HZA6_9ALVE|mmetsp:Transcript_40787/g.80376  ORF Transcript_40787/g.80376 Transcript_40787/m.80376 type:complete len:364 (-) Transcript_40787:45-1136(-)|eukprot:Cvel_9683.t1-p1 / transcript=Cvel_9683.t1 / gene=Cvel_9683 / organism=Chromera_velia_CCMP2878 / gene_product=Trans-2-enoyl-CoA reductase, mitochondrial, putative / transcript_product=Trans-2-enoyl-CoA reductase, mitochondrial, putative / location=Cvel_scaffold564:27931-29019(+) / protein_length=363 / sequence_SO=supercontig / SO=protein_coding / is_pseudo=false
MPAPPRPVHEQQETAPATASDSDGTKMMRKFFLKTPNHDMNKVELEVRRVPLPQPKKGEVLIRVSAAPVNPSDYLAWLTTEKGDKPIGIEGSGVVVASGGGIVARSLVGKTVGFVAEETGSYAEYVTVDALRECFPLTAGVPVEDCASFFVNPFTVIAMLHTVQKAQKAKVFIHTGASSHLGQMMVKLCKTMDVTVVNVVKRGDQAKMLKDLGAEVVVSEDDPEWTSQLKQVIEKLDIKVAFDAVGGRMSGLLMSMLPAESTTYVYGGLAKDPCVSDVPALDLIYKKKLLKGFLVVNWLTDCGFLVTVRRARYALRLVNEGLKKGGWAESHFVDCKPEEMQAEFLKMWSEKGFTGSKLRIRFD